MEPPNFRDALLAHLDRLYLFAQVVAPDADAAVRLTEATYRRALTTSPTDRPPEEAKRWLLTLLVEEARRLSGEVGAEVPAGMADHRQDLAEAVLERAMPAALAALRPDLRLVLLLCELEGLSCHEAGLVLGRPEPDEACHALGEARRTLSEAIHGAASPAERALLGSLDLPSAITAALGRATETLFSPAPPTLQPEYPEPAPPEHAALPTPRPPEPAAYAAEPQRRSRRPLRHVALTLGIIVAAGLVGYLASNLLRAEPVTNLVTLSARQAPGTEPVFRTDDPERAERFVASHLNWRLTIPSIDQAQLVGVSFSEVADSVTVPVFVFDDGGEPLHLYVYTYALLDRHRSRLTLDRDVLRQLEDSDHFDLYDLGETQKVLLWRHRDDIFVAVTSGDAATLRRRIAFPS